VKNKGEYALLIAWLLALIATIVALYASEILNMAVCPLCWDQRICIFPLSLQLGIATFRNDCRIGIYAIPLATIGAILALYQYLIQMIPALAPFTPCRADSSGVSCERIDWQLFGFITFPLLSLVTCVLIIIFLVISFRRRFRNPN
jgi:disulfide bond formation protein DsbB